MDTQGRYRPDQAASQSVNAPQNTGQNQSLGPLVPPAMPSSPSSNQPNPQLQPPRQPRLVGTRRWLGSRTGRIVSLCLIFLIGILIGAVGMVVVAFAISADNTAVANPTGGSSNIVVQIDRTYITHLVSNALQSSGFPGTIQNVQVTPANGDQLTITGDDVVGVLGIGVSHHFTIVLQPFVNTCQIHVHVLHADFGGLTMTQFATVFEGQIDQQIQVNPSKLPKGFVYCTSGVRTDTNHVYVTYTATPLQSS